ncbi:hypothetical protein LSAT2_025973 [Lamellibrachia satsuma]|nr:hypothetical protein LSAT2_025973 [Lamellibrachia satsuma]
MVWTLAWVDLTRMFLEETLIALKAIGVSGESVASSSQPWRTVVSPPAEQWSRPQQNREPHKPNNLLGSLHISQCCGLSEIDCDYHHCTCESVTDTHTFTSQSTMKRNTTAIRYNRNKWAQ